MVALLFVFASPAEAFVVGDQLDLSLYLVCDTREEASMALSYIEHTLRREVRYEYTDPEKPFLLPRTPTCRPEGMIPLVLKILERKEFAGASSEQFELSVLQVWPFEAIVKSEMRASTIVVVRRLREQKL
ncbi:MAG TPA: hypothetical protein VFA15_02240 [Nitrososphaera sp.]|nr:hypothetical protein [Nitrososphaera sp.]